MKNKSIYCQQRNQQIHQLFDQLYKSQQYSMLEIYVVIGEKFFLSTDRVAEIVHKRRI